MAAEAATHATHPRLALFMQRTRTVPAAASDEMTSSTMEPSAHKICILGFMSAASFL